MNGVRLLEDADKMDSMGALAQTEAIDNYSNEKECQRIKDINNTV